MPNFAAIGNAIAHNPLATAGVGAGLGMAAGLGREALSNNPNKNYLGAGLQGAAMGGLLGGAGAGIAHAARDTMLLRPELKGVGQVAMGTAQHIGQGVSNFAQRQFHGLTGYGAKDTAYLDRIGISGSGTAQAQNRLVNMRAENLAKHNPAQTESIFAKAHDAAVANAHEGAMGDRYRALGMTSVPGTLRSAATNPRETAKMVWDQARSGGSLGLAMNVGLPAVAAAPSLMRGDESASGGQTMGEKVMRAGSSVGAGFLFGGVPLAAGNIAGSVAEGIGARMGRAITPPKPQLAGAAPQIG